MTRSSPCIARRLSGRRASLAALVFLAWLRCGSLPAVAADLVRWGGGAAPTLELKDLSGASHDLRRYRGRVVLLNFWATWCEPCRAEMPSMERLRERYSDAPFVVLAVNVDEPEQRVRAFLERMPLGFQVLLDPGMHATRAWNARILPSSFLIGRDGEIRYSARGDVDWSSDPVTRVVGDLVAAPR